MVSIPHASKGVMGILFERLEVVSKVCSLTADAMVWYLPASMIEQVITSCGDFPNVPLMGPLDCINYNPSLATRQLGYFMETESKVELLKDFFLPSLGAENPKFW